MSITSIKLEGKRALEKQTFVSPKERKSRKTLKTDHNEEKKIKKHSK